MKNITNFFLSSKHWVLFALMMGIPFLLMFGGMFGWMFTSINSNDPFESMSGFWITYGLGMFLYMVTFFGWLWSIGTELSKKMPAAQPFNLGRFKIFLIVPVLYMGLFIPFFMGSTMSFDPMSNQPPPIFNLGGVFIILFVLCHLFSMFCIFHSMYQCAKVVKSIELGRRVSFSDFGIEFVLFWFYIIGIWIIQPRINLIHKRPPLPSNDLINHLIE